MVTEPLLEVSELCYRYGKRVSVDAVGFSVLQGEVFGLLGPNGAGKTTTIACLTGLLADWTGNLRFHGDTYSPAADLEKRRLIGFVPQELAVYPNLTARENLKFFAELSGVSKAEITQAIEDNLELAGLADRQHDLVSTFSGGMQRRLNLAIGLLHAPQLVLLDEPTVGVDPQSRNHLFETLMKLKERGLSLIYTTHYMEEAERLCDRIAIMNEGKIVAIGTPQELAEQSGNPAADLEEVFLNLTGRKLRDD